MDAALTPRAHAVAAPVTPRADVTPVRAAVPTLLPQPDQSVAASIEHQAGRFDGSQNRPRARAEIDDATIREIEREVEFHEATRDLVAKTLDRNTGQVIAQFPAETLLKLRAYVQAEADSVDTDPLITRDA